MLVTAKDNSLVNIDISLEINLIANTGTISGYVKHNEVVVQNAFVGLYKANEEGKEVLIAITKTNEKGYYMFGSVESGNYKVKAKLNK